VTEMRLRERLQLCHSRRRLALQALEAFHERLLTAVRECPIRDATELLAGIEHIRTLLQGEEGSHV
jgi:hypothetical protein